MGARNLKIMATDMKDKVKTMIWQGNKLKLIDQRKLPFKQQYVNCLTFEDAAAAIKNMTVRGAPAIGVTAAYGVALAALKFRGDDYKAFISHLINAMDIIASARPTAVNLFWAIDRMKKIINSNKNESSRSISSLTAKIVDEAVKIEKEDVEINCKLGENSLSIFEASKKKLRILTHCNAGALATAGYGTALGVIRSLYKAGKVDYVLVDETRPFLQGARLTAWELHEEKIPFYVICDNMAGYFMSKGEVDIVVVGADRIAANGDTANKIGTLTVSIIAGRYNIPFYVAAPVSTIDLKTKSGSNIPIENRDEKEVREVMGRTIIPDYMKVKNPSFDITPGENITAVITEKGVIYKPFIENIRKLFN